MGYVPANRQTFLPLVSHPGAESRATRDQTKGGLPRARYGSLRAGGDGDVGQRGHEDY